MLTPRFSLSQTDEELCITIHATYAKISETEINIQDNGFTFFSSPYYLRLHLPGKLIDSEEEKHKATYDADKGTFIVSCAKQTHGEYFGGLDMLTDLLTPRGSSSLEPKIELLDDGGSSSALDAQEEEDFDWLYIQSLPTEEEEKSLGYKYGFSNSKTGVFTALRSELHGVVDICDPDNKSLSRRRAERLSHEEESFDENHYLADLFDTDTHQQYLYFNPSYHKLDPKDVTYTDVEEKGLLELPRRDLLIEKGSSAKIYLSLVDILFAWCYNHRITLGENCAESAWNIAKVSSTFSWLENFQDLKTVMVACMRRSLIFPLVRNWAFSLLVAEDTRHILSLGRKQVLKCLLEIQRLFNSYDPYYLLNQLYVTEYCIWIQTASDHKLTSLADSLKKISLTKECINLELEDLESAARIVIEEDLEEGEGANQDAALGIKANPHAKEFDQSPSCNPNDLLRHIEQMTIIENEFALSRNDNDADPILALQLNQNLRIIEDESGESTEDSSDSDDSSSQNHESDSDSDSSSDSTLDSDDDSSHHEDKG